MNTPLLAMIDAANLKGPLLVLLILALVMLVIWDGVWKLIALWKSARHNQLAWFICVAIFNTAGIRSEERRVGKECRSRWSPYH